MPEAEIIPLGRYTRDPEFIRFGAEVADLAAQVEAIEVRDQESAGSAAAILGLLKKVKKAGEAQRTVKIKPFKDQVDGLRGLYKPPIEALDLLIQTIDGKVRTWRNEVRAAEEKERLRLEKLNEARVERAVESGKPAPIVVPSVTPQAKTMHHEGGGSTTFVDHWTFDEANVNLAEVPRRFLMLDKVAVRRAIAEGAREIPGLRIFNDERIASR